MQWPTESFIALGFSSADSQPWPPSGRTQKVKLIWAWQYARECQWQAVIESVHPWQHFISNHAHFQMIVVQKACMCSQVDTPS